MRVRGQGFEARLRVDEGVEVVDDLEILTLQAVEVLLDLRLDDAQRVRLSPVTAVHEAQAALGIGCGRVGTGARRATHRFRPSRLAMYGVTLLPVSPVMTLATNSGGAACMATLLRANLEPSLAVLWTGSRRAIAGTCASISRPESIKVWE